MKSILIAEDDPVLVRGLRDNFQSRGFDVTVAIDGRSAVEEACRAAHDIIILDIMLPLVNGYEVCRRVRATGLLTPIVMLTAKGQECDIVRGLELGADDYVTKPFSIRELIARVEALLRRCAPNSNIVRFADLELDTTAQTLTRSGKPIELTTKEFQLLAFLTTRPNRALTRNEILNQVWGRSVIVTPRCVDRCVTTLRSKIEVDTRNPRLIITVRDVGYRFVL